MSKVKHSVATRKRKHKTLKAAKGFWGDRGTQYQQARRALLHALEYAYRDRRTKKRSLRGLWVARVNAACRQSGLTYSQFVHGLKRAKVALDRKILAELAVKDTKAFEQLLTIAKKK